MGLPNIIFILADDWGYGDVGCLNPESRIPTPCTDAFAREGMTFTDAHANSAVCTPTRYGVLTGRYAWRGHLARGVLGGYDDLLVEPGRPTIASRLRDAGYATACIGKWHLGLGFAREPQPSGGFAMRPWTDDPTVRFDRPLHAGPHTVGFDYSYVIPASLDIPPYVYVENGRVVGRHTGAVGSSPRPAYWRGGACGDAFQHASCLLEFTQRAEQFIADQARESPQRPFFLYFATPSPHTPHVPRAPFRGRSRCGDYGDYVCEHDWSIGRLLEAVDRHGLRDDTLVVITSDNGAHMRGGGFDFAREYGHRSNHIYRGQKSDAWDGGHRVPFLVRWPGVVAPGSTCAGLVCLTDFFATCGELVGRPGAAGGGEDSVSLLPLLRGAAETGRGNVVHHAVDGRFALRQGCWKFIEGPGSGGWSLPDREAAETLPPLQLYDMANDPGEEENLAARHPGVVAELQAALVRVRAG